MTSKFNSLRVLIAVSATASLVLASAAGAAPRSMIGSIYVENPSAGFELVPGVYGRKVGGVGPRTFPPTAEVPVVEVAGATAGTFVGRGVTLAQSQLNRTGFEFRDFPAFANVGQVSKSFMTVQNAATFGTGQGALANCPGPGCTASGAGTAISFCPPNTHNPADPAPGTAMAPIGNWDCPSWQVGAGGGDRFLRIAISNSSGRPNFGGTLSLLRNHMMNVWRVEGQPSTPNANDAVVSRSFMNFTNPWSGGLPNFEYKSVTGNAGPQIVARLNANGAVEATFGCDNGSGTVGTAFIPNQAQPVLGNSCGTPAVNNEPGQGWGFKMTTGTASGSDPYPFGLVVTTVAGTPFNPVFGAQAASLGFFFSRMGTDSITAGGNRNLVMVGGGIAVDPNSGNAFFRNTHLTMNLEVPEPATGLGLLLGGGALVGLVRRRQSRA